MVQSRGELDLSVINHGSVRTGEFSSLIVSGRYMQGSSGTLVINGNMTILQTDMGDMGGSVAGQILGSGLLEIAGDSTLLLESLSFVAPGNLSVLITGAVSVGHNVSAVSVQNWKVDGGSTTVLSEELQLIVAQDLLLCNGGSLSSVQGVVQSDTGLMADATISAENIILLAASSIDLSYAYLTGHSSVTVDSISQITCTGRGYSAASPVNSLAWTGTYSLLGSSGGSHGGLGGSGRGMGDVPSIDFDVLSPAHRGYGSFTEASTWGAPGGAWGDGSISSAGGGFLSVTSPLLTVDGSIRCDGDSPIASLAGGGAGGSLVLLVNTLTGAGSISTNGGNGGQALNQDTVGYGGGGGGGRVRVFTDNMMNFTSTPIIAILAKGGTGFQKGAAGTVFVKQLTSNVDGHIDGGSLTIRNMRDDEASNTEMMTIVDTAPTYGHINLYVEDQAKVIIKTNSETFSIKSINGDATGFIYVINGTFLSVNSSTSLEGNETVSALYLPNVSLVIGDATLDAEDVYIQDNGALHFTQLIDHSHVYEEPSAMPTDMPAAAPSSGASYYSNNYGNYDNYNYDESYSYYDSYSYEDSNTNTNTNTTDDGLFSNEDDFFSSIQSTTYHKVSNGTRYHFFNNMFVMSGGTLKFDYHLLVSSLPDSLNTISLRLAESLVVYPLGFVSSDGQGYVGTFVGDSRCSLLQSLSNEVEKSTNTSSCGATGSLGGGGGAHGGQGGQGLSAIGGAVYGDLAFPLSHGGGIQHYTHYTHYTY